MKIYNPTNLKNKQRFQIAIIVGILAAVLTSIGVALIIQGTGWMFSLVYVAAGYAIAYAIKYFGKGVERKFSILAVACFILMIYLSVYFSYAFALSYQSLSLLWFSIQTTTRSFFELSIDNLIRLCIFGYAGYLAYYEARIM